jgi:hypothetical protein
MKLRKVLIALLAIGCLYGVMLWKSSRSVVSASSPAVLKGNASDIVLASPGRVDSESEVIEVGAAAAGVISSRRILNDLRTLKRLLLSERGSLASSHSAV